MVETEIKSQNSAVSREKVIPIPPKCPASTGVSHGQGLVMPQLPSGGHSHTLSSSRDLWERLFDEGYKADIKVNTDNGGIIFAHSCILGLVSPAIKGMLKQTKKRGRWRTISIHGVPPDAVRVFVRFLYSSCYEEEEIQEFALHLLVLSHAFVVPQLKRICERQIENSLLSLENVIDILQLALLCDAPRLSLICHRVIIHNFAAVAMTEGWKVMKQSHPILEEKLMESIIDEDNRQKERIQKAKERKMYLQLYEAMEALVHICKEGCGSIGPYDRVSTVSERPCRFEACKGLESLIRHFAGCKTRAPRGCIQCKRTWQLLELHSRLCLNPEACRVPLCRNLKERIKRVKKKDAMKWNILVRNILRSKGISWANLVAQTVTNSS